jgi:hypothetical protein
MIRITVLVTLLTSSNLLASGFDEMILWPYDIPDDSSRVINLEPSRICRRGLEGAFLHANPYRIQSLDWDYATVRYGIGRAGLFGQFGSYGLDGYYTKYSYTLGAATRMTESLSSAISGNFQRESFNHAGEYSRADLNIRVSYLYRRFGSILGLSRIKLGSDYEVSNDGSPGPWACISYLFNGGIRLSASIKRNQYDRTRWLISQDIDISDAIDVHIGLLNRPRVFFGRLDLSYQWITLVLSYHSVSRLNDTIVLGLAVGS